MFPFEQQKQFTPDFSGSGKKPLSDVVVDFSNSLAPTRYCYLLAPEREPINMAREYENRTVKQGSNALNVAVNECGQVLDFVNTHNQDNSAQAVLKLPIIGAISTGWILSEFYTDTITAGDGYVFSHGDSTANARLYFGVNGSRVFTRIGAGSSHTSTATIAVGQKVTALVMWSGGNGAMYINGVKDSTFTYTGTPGSTFVNTTFIGQYRRDTFYLDPFDGQIAMLALGESLISDIEGISLTKDPYQFLKPKVLDTYFAAGDDGGGGGFQAAWAKNANMLINYYN